MYRVLPSSRRRACSPQYWQGAERASLIAERRRPLHAPVRTRVSMGTDSCTLPCLDAADLKLTALIANGGFSSVFRALYRGRAVAVKAVVKNSTTPEGIFSIQSFVHECRILSAIKHRCGASRGTRKHVAKHATIFICAMLIS